MGRRFPQIFSLLLCLCTSINAAPFKQTIQTDLDGDGTIERIDVDASREPVLQVWHEKEMLWSGIPRAWKPWKMTTADADGNGKREIVLGVHKATKYFPRPHNCLFIYDWKGEEVRKKWQGSSLSKPFDDFLFNDIDGDGKDEVIALETLEDKKRCVVCYSWNGFGFTADWQCGNWKNARLLDVKDGKVRVAADGGIETFKGEK